MRIDQSIRLGEVDFVVRNVPAQPARNGGYSVDLDTAQRVMEVVALRVIELGWIAPPSFKFLRKALSLSGSALGDLLGVSKESISHWENGKHGIPLAVWAAVAGLVHDRAGRTMNHRSVLEAAAHPPDIKGEIALELAA